jgi:NAD(P)-dependent dehydrogenase (short-subunit alcohol dehydrogenase family)
MSKEKVAIVGGSSGIGLASAQRLAREGYAVVISARSQERLDRALPSIGNGATGLTLDYTDRASIQRFFAALGAFDHLLLVANTPMPWGGGFRDLKTEALTASFDKFWGYFHCLQAALPSLRKDGSVVVVTGAAARAALPGTAGLAAVNGAIERMAITLAKELAPLRINVLSPGVVDTPAHDWMPSEKKQEMLQGAAAYLPTRNHGRVEDLAEAMLFLTRERFITGAILDVDGGAHLG